jgi:hypothetical protein
MADEGATRYNLFHVYIDSTQVICDGLKITDKTKATRKYGKNSSTAYAVTFETDEGEYELSEIDPAQKDFFRELRKSQKGHPKNLPNLYVYNYNEETGDLVEDNVYYNIWIEEISDEDVTSKFTVKGGYLKCKA